MARPKTIHVVPNGSGSWAVKTDTGRAAEVFTSQAEALKAARTAVRNEGGVLHVRKANGEMKTSFTLGRSAMAKINAVEGVALTTVATKAFNDFDKKGLTPSKRREALRKKATKLAGTSSQRSAAKG